MAHNEYLKQQGQAEFTLALSFYSSDNNDISMPLASIGAYVRHVLPDVRIRIEPVFPQRDPARNSVQGYVERLTRMAPDLLGISCLVPNWDPLDPYLRAIKTAMPGLPVLIGGYQAILCPEETIRHAAVDYICVGDGEVPIVQLIQRLRTGQPALPEGIWAWQADGTIRRAAPVLTRDLTTIPFPDYSLFERDGSLHGLNISNFARPDFFVLPVMAGRGCPYHCTYCSNSSMLRRFRGKLLRKYDPDALVAELCHLRDRYDVRFFEFMDEQFIFDMDFVYRFLALYRRQVRRPFSIMGRVEKMNTTFCKAAADAGCAVIWFGIESGSEFYRRNYLKRKMSNQQILTAARNARTHGIKILTLNMVGMPFENRDHMLQTLTFNQTLAPDFFAFFPYLPLKGSELFDIAAEAGLLIDETAPDLLHGYRQNQFRLNLREHPEGVTSAEFTAICQAMLAFAQQNNRLVL